MIWRYKRKHWWSKKWTETVVAFPTSPRRGGFIIFTGCYVRRLP